MVWGLISARNRTASPNRHLINRRRAGSTPTTLDDPTNPNRRSSSAIAAVARHLENAPAGARRQPSATTERQAILSSVAHRVSEIMVATVTRRRGDVDAAGGANVSGLARKTWRIPITL